MPTPTAEGRAAFALAVVLKVAPTAVKWAPTLTTEKRATVTLAAVSNAEPPAVKWAAWYLHQRWKNGQHLPWPYCQKQHQQQYNGQHNVYRNGRQNGEQLP